MVDFESLRLIKRVSVIGTSGSGKSTFSKKLAKIISCDYIEMDALFWQPNWVQSTFEDLQSKVLPFVEKETWVIDGNYENIQRSIVEKADTIIWLDISFSLCLWNVFKRTLHSIIFKKPFFGHSYDSFKRLLSKESIILWVWNTHKSRRIKNTLKFKDLKSRPNLNLFRLISFREMDSFLNELESLKKEKIGPM